MAPLPLLHITQTAARITTVDGRVVAVLALTLLVAVCLIWRDELPRLLSARNRRTLSMRVAAVLVFFAVLPAVLPYDHLFAEHGAISEADETTHSMHCHLTPGSCA